MPPTVFDAFLTKYRPDPVAFVREVVGKDPFPDQVEFLQAYGRRERQIAKRSGHRVGKSTANAWIALHHMLCYYPQKTVCTSASAPQLFDALAAEIKAAIAGLPDALKAVFEIQSETIYHKSAPDSSFISFRTSRAETPEAMAGVHSEYVLLVFDEASGIPEPVYDSASGSMAGKNAISVLTGNPLRTSGLFFDAFHKLRADWWTQHVSCVDHPNVTPQYVDERGRRYGIDSNRYRVRVLGEFPTADDDTIMPFEWVESALHRDVQASKLTPIWGVDCARFGDDASCLAIRVGNTLAEPVAEWKGLSTMELVGRIKARWDETPPKQRPSDINVDVIGLGAGVCDRLLELGLPARGINVSESPALGKRYVNLRAELWFKGRDWLERKDCHLAGDDALAEELVGPRYMDLSNGKLQVESKHDLKKRGVRSPNRADAFLLTLASDAVSASGGSATRHAWSEPLKRPIAGIV